MCAGLDPQISLIPTFIKREAMEKFDVKKLDTELFMHRYAGNDLGLYMNPVEKIKRQAVGYAFYKFGRTLVDTLKDQTKIFKLQFANYYKYGSEGVEAFEALIAYIRKQNCIAINDQKINDIDRTMENYAQGILGGVELCDGTITTPVGADAVTVNAYLGFDGIKPLADVSKANGKGFFTIVKTSNFTSGEVQNLKLDPMHVGKLQKQGRTVYEQMALLSELWGRELVGSSNYSSLGMVIGATYPDEMKTGRKIYRNAMILAPGYGTQNASATDLVFGVNNDGYGIIANNSSSLIFAYDQPPYKGRFKEDEFEKASLAAAMDMNHDLQNAQRAANKWAW